uniref:Anaphase-promoting complex subunit 5 n=1 Tax=Scleropages formosus TaxID=113540 RepID=A0A8C9R1V3_SCLFO
MASVHESLYFNPMMTNGVVHANVFGIKDWVTPYKISVLVLLDEMTISKRMTLLERRRLNKLILPLQQGPDLTLRHFLKTVEECSAETAFAVKLRLHMMVVGELKDMESFFDTLPNPFSDAESEASKTSVVGLFMRHMLLAYNKLSFSQVYKLYTALQRYYDDCLGSQPGPPTAPPVDADMELSEMELTSTEDGAEGKMDKEEPDAGPMQYSELDEAPRRCPLSQKQAEYFLARQAYLLKNDENKALKPAALQEELNNMLKFNPDFAEAHYLSYLNSMRVQDVFISTHSLLHYFDRLILTGGDGKSNGDEGYGRSLRYAALNLAALHCRFGHYQQAELALQEAIRIAQESNDHVCLQHCLSWLYTLEQMKGSDSSVLTEDSVKMAAHFGLPYLASLGIQSLVQQGATGGKAANMLMDALKDTDILHWKHSLSELIDISLAQTTSIWRMYGKSTMALQCAQVLLNMNSLEQVDFGVQQNNTEAFAVVLCHLAELHAEQGLFGASSEILKHLKERFPPHTQHAKLWMLCDLKIQFERAMNDGKYHLAEPHVAAIAALDQMEGLYRKGLVMKAQNQTTDAYRVLQRLQLLCEKTKCTEMIIRVMLTTAELHWESSGFSTALPLLLQALVLARQHHLQALASETILHLAFSQLMLGVPEQALNILHEAMEPILAHGALLDKGRALLLVAKCQMASSFLISPPRLEQAVQTLDEAAAYFSRMGCKDRLRDTHYLQARLHHALGHTAQRNECALLFRMVDQELPPARANLANRL